MTDRAKRYAANREIGLSLYERRSNGCLFCGSRKNLTVDHLDGYEDHGEDANLVYLCKSCNTRKGAAFRKAGIGRLTQQYNPDLGLSPAERRNYEQLGFSFPARSEYDQARAADRKRKQQEHAEAIRRRREERKAETRRKRADRAAEQKQLREGIARLGLELQRARKAGDTQATRELTGEINEMVSDLRRNPAGIRSPRQWGEAVNAVLGGPSYMSVQSAASRIRATPPGQRRKFSASLRNPSGIPTYQQYAFAVSGYDHGKGDSSLSGIIHRTPKAKRAEYARRIAARKREHGTEHLTGKYRETVPF